MTELPRIMIAPNGARRSKADHPALPITLPEIIDTTRACIAQGAEGLHLHLRDTAGRHILDAGLYREALQELEQQLPGFFVQVTTESVGKYGPAAQRALLRALTPRAASVGLREILSDGAWSETRALLRDCAARDIALQFILYDADDLSLWDSFALDGVDPSFLFVLGGHGRDHHGDVSALSPFVSWIDDRGEQDNWAVCAFGPGEIACLCAAHKVGAKMRIGFENAIHRADKTLARDNAERVRDLVAALKG